MNEIVSPYLMKPVRETPAHPAAERVAAMAEKLASVRADDADIMLGNVLSISLENADALETLVIEAFELTARDEDIVHGLRLTFAKLKDGLNKHMQPKIWRLREESEVS
ncbi:MAG: hypothetical protein ACR2RE_06550 [Geminicoccaceae bacterium]